MDYAAIALIIREAKTVQRFVEGYQLPIILGDLGLKAAQSAFQKSADAYDRWSQVWSAITHLETAEQAFKKYLEDNQRRLKWARPHKLVQAVEKLEAVLGLMAICYLYVDEIPLAKQVLTDALYLDYSYEILSKNVVHRLAVAANPLTYWDLVVAVRGQKVIGTFGDFLCAIAEMIEYAEARR